jgi:hypothetical protein
MKDLQNETPGFLYRHTSNNEEIRYYPESDIIEHRYDGFPAMGIVRYDVTSWDIIDYDFSENEFETYESEILELVERLISGKTNGITVNRVDYHTYSFKNPYEGETYVVNFQTENKSRIE